ncbi:MAG: hypothetical protein ACFFF4_06640 [Candidatus Thorarchaeota archaeon]
MSILDEYVNDWDQNRTIIRVIAIDFIILITFLITTIVLFYRDDLGAISFGMMFLGFVFGVPMYFWGDKRKSFTISGQEFVDLSNEKESEHPESISERRKDAMAVLALVNCFLVLIVPFSFLSYLVDIQDVQLEFIVSVIILYWGYMMSSGFAIAYEPYTGGSLHFGRDVPIASWIVKSIEGREDIEDINVRIIIITNMGEKTVIFSHFLVTMADISDEPIELIVERFYGEGTSLGLEIKGSLDLQQMEEPEEYEIELDYTAGFYLHVRKKDFTVNVWYPGNEEIKKVDELSIEGYEKLLDFLFQKVYEIDTTPSPRQTL